MQRSNFLARGVLILAVVFALNAPIYALPSRDGMRKEPGNPIVKIIKKLLKIIGNEDGAVNPWPTTPPPPTP